MPCYHPLRAWQVAEGSQPVFRMPRSYLRNLVLPCGKCIGCRLEYSRQWAIRIMNEAQMFKENVFLTLTYSPEKLLSMSLIKSDFQKFMKRLRKHLNGHAVRYYMCGEYGEEHSRPHFHCVLFGYDFPDKVPYRTTRAGFKLFRSDTLDRIWSHGGCIIGAVSFESAAYVARYVVKKVIDKNEFHEIIDPDSGEIFERVKEFATMSLKPGIGAAWLKKYYTDVYPDGTMVARGVQCVPPRYYDKLFELSDAIEYQSLKARRRFAAELVPFAEGSTARLRVKETVVNARLAMSKRS